jgi:hypothetical protein
MLNVADKIPKQSKPQGCKSVELGISHKQNNDSIEIDNIDKASRPENDDYIDVSRSLFFAPPPRGMSGGEKPIKGNRQSRW